MHSVLSALTAHCGLLNVRLNFPFSHSDRPQTIQSQDAIHSPFYEHNVDISDDK